MDKWTNKQVEGQMNGCTVKALYHFAPSFLPCLCLSPSLSLWSLPPSLPPPLSPGPHVRVGAAVAGLTGQHSQRLFPLADTRDSEEETRRHRGEDHIHIQPTILHWMVQGPPQHTHTLPPHSLLPYSSLVISHSSDLWTHIHVYILLLRRFLINVFLSSSYQCYGITWEGCASHWREREPLNCERIHMTGVHNNILTSYS